jgi:hypothetical protein
MNSTSSSSLPSDKEQIPVEEALRTIQSGLEKVDGERGLAYGTLATLRAAKSNLLDRQQLLLARKLGPDHPRVIALQAQGDLIKRQLPELQAAQVQATTPAPTVEPAGYALHGFVRTFERKPVPRVVVAIYDSNGKKRQDFDYATTDANGYFSVVTSELLGPGQARVRPSDESAEKVALEVRVFDARRRPLKHLLPAIDALPGRVDFREILVDTSSQAAAVPPDTVPKSPRARGRASRREPREKLKIIADELRKQQQFSSVRPTILAAGQKSKKAKSQKQQKRPVAPEEKRRSKKGKSQ